jgi:hypothetical protein
MGRVVLSDDGAARRPPGNGRLVALVAGAALLYALLAWALRWLS